MHLVLNEAYKEVSGQEKSKVYQVQGWHGFHVKDSKALCASCTVSVGCLLVMGLSYKVRVDYGGNTFCSNLLSENTNIESEVLAP